jgi:hypothetical protein
MCLPPSPEYADQQRRKENDEEDEKENLRDLGGARGDPGETEDSRDDRDDEKYDCVSKHGVLLVKAGAPAGRRRRAGSLRRFVSVGMSG